MLIYGLYYQSKVDAGVLWSLLKYRVELRFKTSF